MRVFKQKTAILGFPLLALTGVLLTGCGGAAGVLSAGSSNLNLFVTDNVSDQYSGVWVKVYKASLVGADGVPVEVFNSTEGMSINLRALNDGASRFLLLAPGQVPNGTYNKVEFVLDNQVSLVATGSGATSTAQFPAGMNDANGKTAFPVRLDPPVVVPGDSKFAVDFDLSKWELKNGIVTPVANKHSGQGLDDTSRHERTEFNGVVVDYSSTGFVLRMKEGGKVPVLVTAETDLVGLEGTADPVLANGQFVSILGVFDPAAKSVTASVIRFKPAPTPESEHHEEGEAEVKNAGAIGVASQIDATNGTFQVAAKQVRGFIPKGEAINVAVSADTVYRGRKGAVLTKTDFFANLASASTAVVAVEGTYDVNAKVLTAKSMYSENEAQLGEAEVEGTTSNPIGGESSFDLKLEKVQGFEASIGFNVPVKSIAGAVFQDSQERPITKDLFFQLLSNRGWRVKLKGVYREGNFAAAKLRLDKPTTPEPDGNGGSGKK